MKTFEVDLKKEYGTEGGKLTAILCGEIYDDPAANEAWTRPAVILWLPDFLRADFRRLF